jgi:hypothetical protein
MLTAHELTNPAKMMMAIQPASNSPTTLAASGHFRPGTFQRVYGRLRLSRYLEQALLVSGNDVVIGDVNADSSLTQATADLVRAAWEAVPPRVQILYSSVIEQEDPRLVYIKPLDVYRLTMVAKNDRSPRVLGQLANEVVDSLLDAEGRRRASQDISNETGAAYAPDKDHATYAIVWRPVEPLPRSLRTFIRESAQRLARNKGLRIHFVGVASDHVHLVVECRAGCAASRVAYLFKKGIEEDITDRYGTSVSLWQKGFLADPSTDPIGGEALLAYLSY